MATVHIQCTDAAAATAVVEVFRRGSNGQADSLVHSGSFATGPGNTAVTMPDDCYVVVRAATQDDAKSIDNW